MNHVTDMMQPVFHESLDERIGEPRGVHVWIHDLDAVGGARLECPEMLSADEQAVALRLRSPLARRRFVRSHGVARHLLSGILQTRADDVVLGRSRWGKPFVESPRCGAFDFNFSHSENAFLFGVCFGGAVGVDVEVVREEFPAKPVAECFFAPAERALLGAALPSERQELFFRCWTVKEAFVKLSGCGFAADAHDAETGDGSGRFQTTLRVGPNRAAAAVVWRT